MPSHEDLKRLPAMERDILYLHQELRKPQTVTAKILGVSQPTVNYRYKRARARLEFLQQLPKVTSEEIRTVLSSLGTRPQDIEAMVLYVETNSQSEVARRMNTSQGAVRYWVFRVLTEHLQKDLREDEKHKRVRTACSMLATKPGIFNEPQKSKEESLEVSRRLNQAPKLIGRLVEGEEVYFVDGIYANLRGILKTLTEQEMVIQISLESLILHLTILR